MTAQFRRPAMLDPVEAEQIVGDADPAEGSELAHSTARVLLGRESGVPLDAHDILDLQRLVTVVQTQGVDVISELWSNSPASTLPGMLWRLYLIEQWWQRDPEVVRQRLREGAQRLPQLDENQVEQLGLDVFTAIDRLLHGDTNIDLAQLLRATATVIRIMAEGRTYGANWISNVHDELADEVTLRESALRLTAAELISAAREEECGQLN